jgi:hypothetical protein
LHVETPELKQRRYMRAADSLDNKMGVKAMKRRIIQTIVQAAIAAASLGTALNASAAVYHYVDSVVSG